MSMDERLGRGSGITLDSVVKQYGPTRVLDGISLDVEAGSRVALIGPSGSGKTTILRCVARLEPIQSGGILVQGTDVALRDGGRRRDPAVETVMRRVGMVFQQYNLFPNMSVLENLTLAPRRVLGLDAEEAAETARELLALVGLGDKESLLPAQLSGGQQQRVAIARSLAMQPSVLLFDEVTSALDPELVGEVLDVIRGVAERSSVTMLIVTHEMQFAREVADSVVFMEAGAVVEHGDPERVLGAPQNPRTQQFLRRLLGH